MYKLGLFLFAFALSLSAHSQDKTSAATTACGAENVTFTERPGGAPAQARADNTKPQVYFIQDDSTGGNHQHYTIRVGMDGRWIGAYKRNAWVSAVVDPGEHHVCANVQSKFSKDHLFAFAHFTAEPGAVYYFRTQFLAGLNTMYPTYPNLQLDQPDSDEARYLIASYPASDLQP
jgi:hypothetical protein